MEAKVRTRRREHRAVTARLMAEAYNVRHSGSVPQHMINDSTQARMLSSLLIGEQAAEGDMTRSAFDVAAARIARAEPVACQPSRCPSPSRDVVTGDAKRRACVVPGGADVVVVVGMPPPPDLAQLDKFLVHKAPAPATIKIDPPRTKIGSLAELDDIVYASDVVYEFEIDDDSDDVAAQDDDSGSHDQDDDSVAAADDGPGAHDQDDDSVAAADDGPGAHDQDDDSDAAADDGPGAHDQDDDSDAAADDNAPSEYCAGLIDPPVRRVAPVVLRDAADLQAATAEANAWEKETRKLLANQIALSFPAYHKTVVSDSAQLRLNFAQVGEECWPSLARLLASHRLHHARVMRCINGLERLNEEMRRFAANRKARGVMTSAPNSAAKKRYTRRRTTPACPGLKHISH